MNTIIDSVQQEDLERAERAGAVRVERAYIKDRPNRSELCRSIVTMVQPSESLQ